jgi:hypothetical protein
MRQWPRFSAKGGLQVKGDREMAQLTAPATRGAIQSMWEAGLTEAQMLHLLWLKQDVFAGRRSEITPEHKRLLFARHLYERGLLSDSYDELH